MSIETVKLVVAIAAGGSTGTATTSPSPTGYLEELYLDYGQTSAVTTVTIIELGRSQPILSVLNNQTDGAYHPRAIAVTQGNVSAGSGGVVPIALANPLYVTVTGGNVAAAALTIYAKIRKV